MQSKKQEQKNKKQVPLVGRNLFLYLMKKRGLKYMKNYI